MMMMMMMMKVSTVIMILIALSSATEENKPKSRKKRDLLNMCRMIRYHTGRSCVRYLFHGNYCGPSNVGIRITDPTDHCCSEHDRCSGRMRRACRLDRISSYLRGYRWAIHRTSRAAFCVPFQSRCRRYHCQCDLRFARCLRHVMFNIPQRTLIMHSPSSRKVSQKRLLKEEPRESYSL